MSPLVLALSLLLACGEEDPNETNTGDDTAVDDSGSDDTGTDDTGEESFAPPELSVPSMAVVVMTSASIELPFTVVHEALEGLSFRIQDDSGSLSGQVTGIGDGRFVLEIASGEQIGQLPLTLVVEDSLGQSDSAEILVDVVRAREERHPRYTFQGGYFFQNAIGADDGSLYVCGNYASYYGVAFQVNETADGWSYVKDPAAGPVIGRGCDLGPQDKLGFVGQGKFVGNPQETFVVIMEADGTVALDTRFKFHSNTKSEYTVGSQPMWDSGGGLLVPTVTSYDGGPYATHISRYADGGWTHEQIGYTIDGRLSAKQAVETDGGQLYVAGTARGNVELDGGGGSHSLSDIDFLDVFIAARTSSLGHQDVWFFGNDESTESLAGVDSIGEDLVFAGTTDGTVGAANLGGSDAYVSRMGTDGSLLWTTQMGSSGTDVGTALVHAYGVVYVAGRIESRGVVWALDAQDGSVLWESIIGAEDNNSNIGGIRMDGVDLLISGNSNRDLLSNLDVADNTGSPAFFAWMSTVDGSLYEPLK